MNSIAGWYSDRERRERMDKAELKPCPFCGGNARVIRLGHNSGTAFDDWGVECVKCGALPKVVSLYQFSDEVTIRAQCARIWNQRPCDILVKLTRESMREKSERYVCSFCEGACYYPHGNTPISYNFCPNCGRSVLK